MRRRITCSPMRRFSETRDGEYSEVVDTVIETLIDGGSRDPTHKEEREMSRFISQERFKVQDELLKQAFEEDIVRRLIAFEDECLTRRQDRLSPMAHAVLASFYLSGLRI